METTTVERDKELEAANKRIEALEAEIKSSKSAPKTANAVTTSPDVVPSRRVTFNVSKTQRGNTVTIPESTIIDYCSGPDGCLVRHVGDVHSHAQSNARTA